MSFRRAKDERWRSFVEEQRAVFDEAVEFGDPGLDPAIARLT